MRYLVCAVKDVRAEVFSPPYLAKTLGEALRSFQDVATDAQSTIFKHPSDFCLVEIGSYEDGTGVLVPSVELVTLAWANEFRVKPVAPAQMVDELNG